MGFGSPDSELVELSVDRGSHAFLEVLELSGLHRANFDAIHERTLSRGMPLLDFFPRHRLLARAPHLFESRFGSATFSASSTASISAAALLSGRPRRP